MSDMKYTFNTNLESIQAKDTWMVDVISGIFLIRTNEDPTVWCIRSCFEEATVELTASHLKTMNYDLKVGDQLPEWENRHAVIEAFMTQPESPKLLIKIKEL